MDKVDAFCDLWLVQTYSPRDFLPGRMLWRAIAHAAGVSEDSETAWNTSRRKVILYIKRRYGLPPRQWRYHRNVEGKQSELVRGGPCVRMGRSHPVGARVCGTPAP